MSKKPVVILRCPLITLGLILLFTLQLTSPARAEAPCEAALASPVDTSVLFHETPFVEERAVSEWESEVVKLQSSRPGLLVVEGKGASAQGTVFSADSSAKAIQLGNSGALGDGRHGFSMLLPAGSACLQVTPTAGASGSLRVQVTFLNLCHLGARDDHGDSFACATELLPGKPMAGEISPADQDVFSFVLGSPSTVVIESSSRPDLGGSLFDAEGRLLSTAEKGQSTRLRMTQALGAGRYFFQVEGAKGARGFYSVRLAL